MRAVVFKATREVAVEDVPDARVERAVHRVQRGDRVVLPAHIYCGVCFNCARGDSAACLRVQPGHAGGAYAMPGMGPFRGSQAELVRVPFADAAHTSETFPASSPQAAP